MLKDAASNAKPKKYAQNNGHGIYEGTMGMMDSAAERCRAPKTAKGTAKHKLLKATSLSRPRACTISVFAAHSATRKSRVPAPHIETTVREISKNVARMVMCMWMASASSRAQPRARLPGQYSLRLYNEDVGERTFLRSWTDARPEARPGLLSRPTIYLMMCTAD